MSRADELRGLDRFMPAISDYPGVHFEDAEPIMLEATDGEYVKLSDVLALLTRTEAAQANSSWSLFDRVDFALRDAGFDFDEASNIAALAAEQEKALAGAHTAKAEAAPVVDGVVADVIDADWGAAFNLLGPMPPIGTKLYTHPQDASARDAEDAAMFRWLCDNARPWDSGYEQPHALIRICRGEFQGGVGWFNIIGRESRVGIITLRDAVRAAMRQEAGK